MAEQVEAVRDVVVVGGAAGLSAALTLACARRRVTVVDSGEPRSDDVRFYSRHYKLDAEDRAKLDALGVPVILDGVSRVEIDDDRLQGVRLDDGQVVEVEVLAVATRMVARAEVFAGIEIAPTAHPMGSFIAADRTGRTSVPGVWVAGKEMSR